MHIFVTHRYEDICPSTHNMDVPHVKREDYQLTDISDDGYLTLMNDNGDLREDLKLPESDIGTQLRSDFDAGRELLVRIYLKSGWICLFSWFCFCWFKSNVIDPIQYRSSFICFFYCKIMFTVHCSQIVWRGMRYRCQDKHSSWKIKHSFLFRASSRHRWKMQQQHHQLLQQANQQQEHQIQ